MSFVVWVVLDGLPPVVHVVEVVETFTTTAYTRIVDDLDQVRPAAVDALMFRLVAEFNAHTRRAAEAETEDEYLDAIAGLQLVELYGGYVVDDDGASLALHPDAELLFLDHGVDPLLWAWTISDQGGQAAAG